MSDSTVDFLNELQELMEQYDVIFEVVMEPFNQMMAVPRLEITSGNSSTIMIHHSTIDSGDIRDTITANRHIKRIEL